MSTSRNLAVVWESWRGLYPLYATMAREFVLDSRSCSPLDENLSMPSAEAFAEAEQWFEEMDQRIQIQHLRQFAQTSPQINESALKNFIVHQLNKKTRTEQDRDKIDFLLVQFLSWREPTNISEADLTLESVAKNLEPVLGPSEGNAEALIASLDGLLQEAGRTQSLNALLTSRVIERGRELKASCGRTFFEPVALTAFARFGFLIRRHFFRLMQQDLNAILDGLHELEAKGVTALDCRKAQFAADEPINRLLMICHSWRVMFQAEYSSGQPLGMLVDLRTAVDSAVVQNSSGAPNVKSKAAAVGEGSSQNASQESRVQSSKSG